MSSSSAATRGSLGTGPYENNASASRGTPGAPPANIEGRGRGEECLTRTIHVSRRSHLRPVLSPLTPLLVDVL
ncbi:hypothetical protein Mapa_006047 [Marchantia paleacea]|nr:hypothetical protein Mapa_006047 [Marchantia paleacea]